MSVGEPSGELFRSGAPIWSFTGYRTAFAFACGSAIAGWCLAALTWWRRARSLQPRARLTVDLAGLLAIAVVVLWIIAVAIASEPPADGQFCFTPSPWAGPPEPTCIGTWPVRLMAATSAWPLAALAVALCARGTAFHDRRRIALYGVLAVAMFIAGFALGPTGLVTPDMFSDGGIIPSGAAAIELTASGEVGIATLIALVACAALSPLLRRPASTGKSNATEVPPHVKEEK